MQLRNVMKSTINGHMYFALGLQSADVKKESAFKKGNGLNLK
jgi:hypothetical protein